MDRSSDGTSYTNETLQKVAKGAVLVFAGNILSLFFAFIARVLLARNFTQAEYGIFCLGFTILSISVSLGTLGLSDGAARQIAYYLGRKESEKARNVVLCSIMFGLLGGFILFLLIFFSSDILSVNFFHLPELSYPLKLFSIAVPFFVLIYVLTAIFRGFSSVKEKVIFTDTMRNLFFLFILSFVIWIGLSFKWAIIAYFASIILTFAFFMFYFVIKKPFTSFQMTKDKINASVGKELLFFSLPLLLLTLLYKIMTWTDTLMLGYFRTAEIVGIYNAALPLGNLLWVAFGSMIFIYMPVFSELYGKNRIYEMRRSYIVLVKWLYAVMFPMAMVFAFFPNIVINFLFGHEYTLARTALQIFAVGFFITGLMGLNGAALTAMGKIKFLMYATFTAACINVMLNVFLIPRYGVNGAAIATIIALFSLSIIRSIKLYSISKIHSLRKNILKPVILSIILVLVMYFIVKEVLAITYWMLPILFVLFMSLYVFSLLITKSFDKEDIDMLLSIEKRTGINLSKVRRLIKRFI